MQDFPNKVEWFGRGEWFITCKARDLTSVIQMYARKYKTLGELINSRLH